jgi:hypothetical protein
MPLAALTVMLWLLWSDSLRKKRAPKIFYFIRAGLYVAMTAVLIFNLVSYPELFPGIARIFAIIASVVGVGGAFFFFRKGTAKA